MTDSVSRQAEKALKFAEMHQPGDPLVLYNIWDAGSAKVVETAGARAVATGSWSIAAAQGFDDGEKLPLEIALMTARRICQTVDLPVSLDFEGAYAIGPTAVGTNVTLALKQGIVGINFEDQMIGGKGLHKLEDHAKRIAGAREAATSYAVPLFINARTDVFLKESNQDWHAGLMPQVLERLEAYTSAGASGFFVPGLQDPDLIGRICEASEIPVNVMITSKGLSVAELADLGVARISHGPGPYRQAMRDLAARFVDSVS